MPASSMWNVKEPGGAREGAFKASKTLYTSIGTDTGVVAIPTAQAKTTPLYSVGELLKAGWLVAVNVYIQKTANQLGVVSVYCSSEKVDSFIAKCRTNPSGLAIGGKTVTSASRPRRQTFS